VNRRVKTTIAGLALLGASCSARQDAPLALPPAFAPAVPGEVSVAGAADREQAMLTVTVRWPDRETAAYRAQLIPTSADKISLAVSNSVGNEVATADVVLPATTATMSIAPGNNYAVSAKAFKGATGPLARGIARNVDLLPGRTASVNLPIQPDYIPAIVSFDRTAGRVGESITITGSNLKNAWASAPTVKLEGAGGASVSASITASSNTSLTFTVPAGSAVGRVEITADGVKSRTNSVFWVGDLSIDAPVEDMVAWPGDNRFVTKNKTLTFSQTHSFSYKAGQSADDFGGEPALTWASSNGAAGSLGAPSGNSVDFTAGGSYATSSISASIGGMASSLRATVTTGALGPATAGPNLIAGVTRPSAVVFGNNLYMSYSNPRIMRAAINANRSLGSFGAEANQPANIGSSFNSGLFAIGGKLWVVPGAGCCPSPKTGISFATVNSDGTLGAFSTSGTTSVFTVAGTNFIRKGRYMYKIGGRNGSIVDQSGIERFVFNSTGGFQSTAMNPTSLPVVTKAGAATIAAGKVFHLQASGYRRLDLSADGSTLDNVVSGTTTGLTSYPCCTATTVGDTIFVAGSWNSDLGDNRIMAGPVNTTGAQIAFTQAATMGTARMGAEAIVIYDRLYVFGGRTAKSGGSEPTATEYFLIK